MVSKWWGVVWTAALLALVAARPPSQHNFNKRSFSEYQCKGENDESIFARVDRVCEDCDNLHRDARVLEQCRQDCFTSDRFTGCLEALQKQDQTDQFKMWIKQLHGEDSGA